MLSYKEWTTKEKLLLGCWEVAWFWLCRWTPKPLNKWRLFVFSLFGGKHGDGVFVHQRTRIHCPWMVELASGAQTGYDAVLYNFGKIHVGEGTLIGPQVLLCGGTHDTETEGFPLMSGDVRIGARCFVGARATLLPGVSVGDEAVVGACAVVTRDVPARTVSAGNPAKVIKEI